MSNDKIFAMPFAKVFPLLIAKAERKGRTRAEVYEVTTWLTGYTAAQLDALLESAADYGSFWNCSINLSCDFSSPCCVRYSFKPTISVE